MEATGEANPLGWTPPDFTDGEGNTHVMGYSTFNVECSPQYPEAEDSVTVRASIESQTSTINTVTLSYQTGEHPNGGPNDQEGKLISSQHPPTPRRN
ncbi:MAG: hypothetical protein ACOC6H_03825 [Thermoproteota archaeon]